jgi:hypothetical protein
MFGNCGQDVERETIGLREIAAHEVNLAVHERRDERYIATEPVQLRDDQSCPMSLAGRERFGKLRPIAALAALDLDEFADQLPRATIQIVGDRFSLSAPRRRAALASRTLSMSRPMMFIFARPASG